MSVSPPASAGLKFVALVSKETQRPSALIDGLSLALSDWTPPPLVLTRVVWPLERSFMKMSVVPLLSPETRFAASDWKRIFCPSPLMLGRSDAAFASAPLPAEIRPTGCEAPCLDLPQSR